MRRTDKGGEEMQIINAKIVLPDRIIENGVLRFEDGVITYVGTEYDPDVRAYDAMGDYLLPGFVDIHCHGGDNLDFMDSSPEDMRRIADFHLSHGTTTLVATTMTDTLPAIEDALSRFAALGEDRSTLHGVHLEGPWLSPKQCGAQDSSKMTEPSGRLLSELVRKYPFIERVTVAPECDTRGELAEAAKSAGVRLSIGHTDTDFDGVIDAADRGYTLLTHLYSGMKGVERVNAFRVAGAVEGGLYEDRLTAEVICDGCHLPEGLLKLIYKCKGRDRICLITDAMRGAGLKEGSSTVLGRLKDGVPCIVEDGVAKLPDRQSFAGSVATTERLFRTAVKLMGVSLNDASVMLSRTPARVMGYTDRGELKEGMLAHLVLMNEALEVKKVFR